MAGRYSDIYSDTYAFEAIQVGLGVATTSGPHEGDTTAAPRTTVTSSAPRGGATTSAPRGTSTTDAP